MRGLWYVQLVQVRTKCRSPQTRESNAESNAVSNDESNAECINSNNYAESRCISNAFAEPRCISNAFADLEPGERLCRGLWSSSKARASQRHPPQSPRP